MSMEAKLLFEHSEMSLASYSDLESGVPNEIALQQEGGGLSFIQSTKFTSHYNVITQYNDQETSFSATVFKDSNGSLTLAIRGTSELVGTPNDLAPTDLDIWLQGAGYDQIVAMYNWWQRIANPADVYVKQFRLASYGSGAGSGSLPPIDAVKLYTRNGISVYLEEASPVLASGELAGELANSTNSHIDVTGHSLGGHLALAFNALFSEQAGQVTTFNAPGFKDTDSNRRFFEALGGQLPGVEDNTNVLNVIANEADIGETAFNGIAGLHSRPGAAIDIAIEDQWLSGEPSPASPAFNHSQMVLTDSLAVYRVLGELDPGLSPADYRTLLHQSADQSPASYEGIVDALGRLFGTRTEPLPAGNDRRNELYTAIYQLLDSERFQQAAGQDLHIRPLTESASLLTLKAEGAALDLGGNYEPADVIAYRYALVNLAPFAVTGSESLYTPHNDRDQLEFYDPETGEGTLTSNYLTDRAGALGIILQSNLGDRAAVRRGGRHARVGTDFIDHDADGGTTTLARIAGRSQGGARTRQVRFGSDAGETLYGSAPGVDDGRPDRLEGGARLYRHATRAITLTVADGRAVFSRRDGSVTVEAFDTETQPFDDGDFGISLTGSEEPDSNGLNIVDGTDGDESLTAGTELNGDAGDDLIRGFAGDDDLYGRRGRDILEGGIGTDYLNSSAFLDGTTLFPDDPGDWLFGGDSDDIVMTKITARMLDTDWSFTCNPPPLLTATGICAITPSIISPSISTPSTIPVSSTKLRATHCSAKVEMTTLLAVSLCK